MGPKSYASVASAIGVAGILSATTFGVLGALLARFGRMSAENRPLLANIFYRFVFALCFAGAFGVAVLGWSGQFVVAAVAFAVGLGAFEFAVQAATADLQPMRVGRLFLLKSGGSLVVAVSVMAWGGNPFLVVTVLALVTLATVALFGREAFLFRWQMLDVGPSSRSRELFRYALPLSLVAGLGYLAVWIDRVAVARFIGVEAFGSYVAVADLVQQLVGMLFGGIGAAWYPRLVLAHSRGDLAEVQRLFSRSIELVWVLVAPAVVGIAITAPSIVKLLLGARYQIGAADLWPYLVTLGAGLAGVKAFVFDLPLFLRGQTWRHLAVVLLVVVIGLAASLAFVPAFGLTGAAGAYCFAISVGAAISLMLGGEWIRPTPVRSTTLRIVVALIGMSIVVGILVGPTIEQLASAVFCGTFFYCVALWVLDVSDVRPTTRRIWSVLNRSVR